MELAVSLVSALYAAARYDEAEQVAGQVLAPGPDRVDADHALTLYVLMAQNLHSQGKVAPAIAVLDRADAERDWTPSQQLHLQVTRQRTCDWTDRPACAQARIRARELLPLAEQLGDSWATATLWLTVAEYFPQPMADHDPLSDRRFVFDETLRCSERGLAAVQGHPELLPLQLKLQVVQLAVLSRALQFGECATEAARVRALAERAGNRHCAGHAAHYGAVCLFQFGRWDDLPGRVGHCR